MPQKYHFEPKSGWMNDPNGLIYYNNHYHIFFQHNPHDIKWGPMHWGHAVSEDLIHWEELEIALFPDMDYEDDGGCFSGSAIEKDGRLYLIYTSVSKRYGQSQSIAWSDDGIHFTKYENNPVIAHFPEDASADFRDPKVFEYNGEYRMIVGTKYGEKGRIVQYSSLDLLTWEYIGVLYEDNQYDNVIECPDLFCIDGRWVLMYSAIGKKNSREHFYIGNYDGERFVPNTMCLPEYGPQFYAAQTFEAKGKRILIGWFYDWDIKSNTSAKAVGAMTIPRIVSIDGNKVKLYPVEEAAHLMEKAQKYNDDLISVNIEKTGDIEKLSISGDILDEPIEYSGKNMQCEMIRDWYSIELFINGGEKNISINYSGGRL